MFPHKSSLTIAALIMATAFGAPAHAAGIVYPKSKTYDITFDGFCDGMTLTLSNKVYIVGQSTGCNTGYVDEGFLAKRTNSYFDVSSNNGGITYPFTYVIDDPRSGNRGWCDYYTTDGVTQIAYKCGTYTVNVPGRAPRSRGLLPSSPVSR